LKNTTSYAILCLLSIEPMSGYMMKKWVDRILSHFWKISYGQLYPTLEKLHNKGLVSMEYRKSKTAPTSKFFHITEKGLAALTAWLEKDTLDFNYRDESLMQFYFSGVLPIDKVIEKAERHLEFQQEVLDKYTADMQRMKAEVPNPTRLQLMQYITTKKGVYLNEARLKWAQDCIEALNWYKKKQEETKEEET